MLPGEPRLGLQEGQDVEIFCWILQGFAVFFSKNTTFDVGFLAGFANFVNFANFGWL